MWNWLVVYLPLGKMWVRQLGLWHSQCSIWKVMSSSHVPNHQPDPMVFLWFSYGWSMVFLWFSYGCPMVFLWFSYGCPMVSMICSKPPGMDGKSRPRRPEGVGLGHAFWRLQNDHIGTVRSRLWYPKKTWWLIYIYICIYDYVYIYMMYVYIYMIMYIYICRYVWTCWDFLKTSTMVVYPKNNSYNLGMGQTQPIRMAHFGMLPKSRRDLSSRVNRFTPQQGGAAHTCISEVSDIHKHLV